MFVCRCAMSNMSLICDNQTTIGRRLLRADDPGDASDAQGHSVACSANAPDAARTTQNRWPVGASMTHQV